jgi:hypothetical protein
MRVEENSTSTITATIMPSAIVAPCIVKSFLLREGAGQDGDEREERIGDEANDWAIRHPVRRGPTHAGKHKPTTVWNAASSNGRLCVCHLLQSAAGAMKDCGYSPGLLACRTLTARSCSPIVRSNQHLEDYR